MPVDEARQENYPVRIDLQLVPWFHLGGGTFEAHHAKNQVGPKRKK